MLTQEVTSCNGEIDDLKVSKENLLLQSYAIRKEIRDYHFTGKLFEEYNEKEKLVRIIAKLKGVEQELNLTKRILYNQNSNLNKRVQQISEFTLEKEKNTQKIKDLTEKLHNSEVTFESQFQILEFYQQLVNNLIEMITSLPKNSPLRRPILSELSKNEIDKEVL